jgi:hypothetical protein
MIFDIFSKHYEGFSVCEVKLLKNSMECGDMIVVSRMYKPFALLVLCISYKVLLVCKTKVSKVQ